MIRYRHPRRPDEAGMTIIADEAQAQAMIERLEQRGFQVEKLPVPLATAARRSAGLESPGAKKSRR
jgi:hypothetical protein